MTTCEHGKAYDEYCHHCAAAAIERQRKHEPPTAMLMRMQLRQLTPHMDEVSDE